MGFYDKKTILNEEHIILFDALKFRTVFQMMRTAQHQLKTMRKFQISNMIKNFSTFYGKKVD